APLERLQMDLVNLLSFAEHNDGYSYILTMIDVFSRVWVILLKDKEGSTINKKLARHFSMFSPPTELQSDNGSEFITDVLKKTCETLKIQLIHGRVRHPQTQGKIERFNQTLGRRLTKCCGMRFPKPKDIVGLTSCLHL
ncbi:1870_t:CDS:2, partial [Paraglomus brasilianum]